MRAPLSPIVRRILRNHPDAANAFVRALRDQRFIKITTEEGTVRYFGPTSAGKPNRDGLLEIDLSSDSQSLQ